MICQGLTREQSNTLYAEALKSKDTDALRRLCREDLFFLLTIGLKRPDANNDFVYDRCREVELNPNGYLDLWAREHFKSTIITFALTIQDILKDPDETFGIFSHTRPIAKGFLLQIMMEFENNTFLIGLFPDVLYKNPRSEAPKWSLDSGIIVKRKSNPKESTVEAWGVVDGQPTSKHFSKLVYDDLVTLESVNTPEQIKKTTSSLRMSFNLGARGGAKRFIGTRYHLFDTYAELMKDDIVKKRIYPATRDGKYPGEPILLTKEQLAEKRKEQGPYIFGTQMLQNPVADNAMGFKEEWLKFYDKIRDFSKWNLYILVDPAGSKNKTSDYTVMEVIGLAPDNNYYLIDAVKDRLNLTQRTEKLFELHKKYKPKSVGYEKYGMQADIEHIKYVQEQENYRFQITEVSGIASKESRIERLIPIFEQRRFYMPKTLRFVNSEGKSVDYIQTFIQDEYLAFPVSVHDDMLDCRARILDVNAKFPKIEEEYDDYQPAGSWMG